jgi:potassium-transporting ATPase KdpC subunit
MHMREVDQDGPENGDLIAGPARHSPTREVDRNGREDEKLMTGLARPVLMSAGLFLLVTGLGYPIVTTGVAALLFPHQSRGSLVTRDGNTIGSAIIGQSFAKPDYFHPRPSVTTGPDPKDPSKSIDQPYNAANSGASNLGPTSKSLIDTVKGRAEAYRQENGLAQDEAVPVDAVTASASGLDPDISVANARLQAKRVALARGIPAEQVSRLIEQQTIAPQLGFLGNSRVNVLELNLALDKAAPRPAAK